LVFETEAMIDSMNSGARLSLFVLSHSFCVLLFACISTIVLSSIA
ncbi:8909_t:CDS:1, partial [Gigaspora rosea]